MKPKALNAYRDTYPPLWKWNPKDKNQKKNKTQFPVTEFLREIPKKVDESVLGPGGGAGIGCGVGLGLGLVGGVGFGGWPWNQLKLVFGLGMGCGVGLGFGYGRGLGYGVSLDSILESPMLRGKPEATKKRMLIEI